MTTVGFGCDFICLQEVGGLGELVTTDVPGQLQQFYVSSESDLHDSFILGSVDTQSYLGQVIVLDKLVVDRILQSYLGTRWIAVRFVDVQHTERVLVGVHMPHRDNAEQYYEQSVLDLELFLRSFQHLPCSLAGDWNADVDDSRFATLSSMCSSLSFKCFHPATPTWHGRLSHRMLDYFFFNRHALEGEHMHAEPELQHHTVPAKEVGTDHDLVQLKFFMLCSKGVRQPRPRRRNRCNKWVIATNKLDKVDIDQEFFRQQSAKQQWEVIRNINDSCAVPMPSLKYKDPHDLKELCRQRHYTTDPADKTRLAKQILSRRREARSLWLQGLTRRASAGDGAAVAYLHNRSKPKPSHHKFVQASGGKQAAAQQVQERMEELLSAKPAELDAVSGWEARLADPASSTAPCKPVDDSEILQSVRKLKRGKTSGLSGVSAELMRALVQLPDGLAIVRHHMNVLLRDGEPPTDYFKTYVALIEKCPQVARARDLRPINLMEVLNKLFMGLLTTRLQPTVPNYSCQFAGRPGHQTLDALSTAHHMVDRETKWNKSSVWISLDVSAAFDSLALSQVGAFLHEEVGPQCRWEALRMFQFMKHSHLEFHYMGQQWSVDQTSGVQQGGSHSSWVFSCVLARQIHRLFERWHQNMPPSLHPTYGLLYIDDILVCLPDWHKADAMYEQLQDTLKSLGLTINVEKTHLMASHSFLQEGQRTLPEHSVLRQLKWATNLQYLKKWLAHDHSSSLIKQAQQCIHSAHDKMSPFLRRLSWQSVKAGLYMLRTYVASTWLWFAPLVFPLVKHTEQMDTWQCMYCIQTFKLYLPASLSQDLAYSLVRVRRRAVRSTVLSDDKWRWVSSWVKRKWCYLGHILRKGEHHVALAAMTACTLQQHVGAPWSSSFNWLLKTAQAIYDSPSSPTVQQLQHWAQDRQDWASKSDAVRQRYQGSFGFQHSNTYSSIRRPFSLQLGWLQCIYAQYTHLGWVFHTLHPEQGWVYYVVGDYMPSLRSLQEVLDAWAVGLQYMSMLSDAWVLQLFLSVELQDVTALMASPLHRLMWSRHDRSLLFEYVSSEACKVLDKISHPL